MKLYIPLGKLYVAESGRINTPASEKSFLKVIRLCQSQYPRKEAEDFTSSDLAAFCLSRNVAPSTIKVRKAHIKSLWKWAAFKGIVPANVSTDLDFLVVPGNGRVRLGNWLTEEEAARIFRSYDESNLKDMRDRLIFLLGITLGLRVFEIAGLKWSQFSDDYSTVELLGKGRKLVRLTVPPQLRKELLAWNRHRIMGATCVIPGFRWHWTAANGRQLSVMWDKPLTDEAIRYVVNGAGERIGRKLTPHDLRRSFLDILVTKGVPLEKAQLLMRHSNLATTSRYLDQNPARAGALMNEMTWDF